MIRLTVHPDEDVDLADGARFGDVRPALVALLGRADLRDAPLFVGRVRVDDEALVGHFPLLPGALLTTQPAPDDVVALARRALQAPWHLRVVAGPGAGRIVPLGAARRPDPAVGRRSSTSAGTVGAGIGSAGAGGVGSAEVGGAGVIGAGGTEAAPGRAPGWEARVSPRSGRPQVRAVTADDRPGGRWRRLRDGVPCTVASSTIEAVRRTTPGGHRAPGRRIAAALATAVPALGSLAVAVAMRQPLFALIGLATPLGMLARGLATRRHGRMPGVPPDSSSTASGASPSVQGGSPTVTSGGSTGAVRAGERGDPPADESAFADPNQLLHAVATGRRPAPVPAGVPAAVSVGGPARLSLVRLLACAFAGAGYEVTLVVDEALRTGWAWTRWLGARIVAPHMLTSAENEDRPTVVVAIEPDRNGWLTELSAWWARASPEARLLLLPCATAPAWCRRWTGPPSAGVDALWAESVARHLGSRARGDAPHHPGLARDRMPGVVGLLDLLGPDDHRPGLHAPGGSAWVAERWARPPSGLLARLGAGAGGRPVDVDLVADGPHGLVAGTTGAGKSELLQTLVASLALTYSPEDLSIALVDYKGGASFGACARLPHVVGLVTDLEPGLAGRALTGLRAELARRERLFARTGAVGLDEHRARSPDPLPRLLIVVDEFRAMADDLPDFVPGLLRIAAQGRSLGIHLVLATQRPGGAVSADMRANLGLRICLRVADTADSRDVVDSPDAASLPASAPGRALLLTSRSPVRELQCAHASAVPSERVLAARAPAWTSGPAARSTPGQGPDRGTSAPDVLTGLIEDARAAHAALGLAEPHRPWLPGLPGRITLDELDDHLGGADHGAQPDHTPALAFGVLDDPATQSRRPLVWRPDAGHLSIEGPARSGRSTALHTLAAAALRRGWHVHALCRPRSVEDLAAHPGVGTVVGADDPLRAAVLLRALVNETPPVPRLLVVDDLEQALAGLGQLARGTGADTLTAALRAPRERRLHVVLVSARPLAGTLAPLVGRRLVLCSASRQDDVARGVPTALAGLGSIPGRGVWFGDGDPLVGQVALGGATLDAVGTGSGVAAVDARGPDSGRDPARASRPARIVAVPAQVSVVDLLPRDLHGPDRDRRSGCRPEAPSGRAAHANGPGGPDAQQRTVAIGLGGPDAEVRHLDVARGALVVGPPGSGRSTALALVCAGLGPGRLLVIARDGPLLDVAAAHRVHELAPAAVRSALDALDAHGAGRSREPWTIVVDDLEVLAQTCPAEAELLLPSAASGSVVAAAATGSAAAAMRGPLAALRAVRTGVVLAPGTPGSSDVFGSPLTWFTEPGPCGAGRGVLVHGRHVELVQLAHG